MPFLIIFIGIPFIEIAVFMSVGEVIGIWTTLLLALFTAILGGMIIRYQGMYTVHAVQAALRQGKTPLAEIFDGFCLVASGALLITPGFVTDGLGFALLIPQFRSALRHILAKHSKFQTMPQNPHTPEQSVQDNNIIEADYERVEDEDKS